MKNLKKKIVIGLTGGIGSGKSVAADILSDLNAYIIDADVISKEVLSGGASEIIKLNFPECVENGQLNRAKLKQLIFADESKRQKINNLTHPLIFERINAELKTGINIVIAPLLFESGYNKHCDYILSIIAGKNTRIKRVCSRDGVKENTAARIMDTQIEQEQLIKLSDFVIYNDSDLNSLKEKVVEWFKDIQERDFG